MLKHKNSYSSENKVLQQVIKPVHVTVMGVHIPTQHSVICVHAYIVTLKASNPCRGAVI